MSNINNDMSFTHTDHEIAERLKCDRRIQDDYAHARTQINEEKLAADKSLLDYKANIRQRVESEVKLELSRKYTEEQSRGLNELAKTIEIERESKLQICDAEASMYVELKKRELRLWESKERSAIQQQLRDYEISQREAQKKVLDAEIEIHQTVTRALLEKDLSRYSDSKKREFDNEMSLCRADEFRKIKKEIDEFYKSESERIRNDLSHFESTERLAVTNSIEAHIQSLKRDIERTEADLRSAIAERIAIHEESETNRVVAEREYVITQKLETIRQIKEEELLDIHRQKETELNIAHLNKLTQLDILIKTLEAEKRDKLMADIELQKIKLSQDVETQYQKDLHSFRAKISDDYAKIHATEKERNDKEMKALQEQHAAELERQKAEIDVRYTEENEKHIQSFKIKLNDEFTRLRLVEKMLLQSDLEKEYERLRESLSPEYSALKKQAEYELLHFKQEIADNLAAEKIKMEEQAILAHSIISEKHKKALEEELAEGMKNLEKEISEEKEVRRSEILNQIQEELAEYKAGKIKDITHDISIIRERELEEMRESLYVLAMERVKEKLSSSVRV